MRHDIHAQVQDTWISTFSDRKLQVREPTCEQECHNMFRRSDSSTFSWTIAAPQRYHPINSILTITKTRVWTLYDDQNRCSIILYRLGSSIMTGQPPWSKVTGTWHFPICTWLRAWICICDIVLYKPRLFACVASHYFRGFCLSADL
jgi:hypothetical protein